MNTYRDWKKYENAHVKRAFFNGKSIGCISIMLNYKITDKLNVYTYMGTLGLNWDVPKVILPYNKHCIKYI